MEHIHVIDVNKNKRIGRIDKQLELIKSLIKNKQLIDIEILEIKLYQSILFLFSGSISSPYQGFWFRIKVQWTDNYPYEVPKVTLLDKIWNPYVDFETNQICIDIIHDNYSPALKTSDIVVSIVSLLSQSKIKMDQGGFINPHAAIQMYRNYDFFCQHARQICQKYSYKQKQIYEDSMRGSSEEHLIHVIGKDIKGQIIQDLDSKKFHKKPKNLKSEKIYKNTLQKYGFSVNVKPNDLIFQFENQQYIMKMKKQLASLQSENLENVQILEISPGFKSVVFAFCGPMDSPYAGYWFRVQFNYPKMYPNQAPTIKLIDKIWSPFVDKDTNEITIQKIQSQKSQELTTKDCLMQIIRLLGEHQLQNEKQFSNLQAANQMNNDYPSFFNQARKMCESNELMLKLIWYQNSERQAQRFDRLFLINNGSIYPYQK